MPFISSVWGFFSAFFIGFFLVSSFLKKTKLSFRILFGIATGYGITSVLYFLTLVFNIYNFEIYRNLETFLLIVSGILYFFKNEQVRPEVSKFSWTFSLVNFLAVLIFLKYFMNNTLGSWDGFRIWNIKAEFLFQTSPIWKNVFVMPHFMMHNDYPLFLPSSAARLWKYAGTDSTNITVFLAFIFTFSVIYLLYFAIEKYRGKKLALAVTSVYALNSTFLVNGASQCADIPLSFMILCSVVSLFFFFERNEKVFLIFSVLFAGLSAWTKNEGMMYFLILCFVISVYFLWKKKLKDLSVVYVAAIPAFVLLLLFKMMTKTPNDLVMGVFLMKTYTNIWHPDSYFFTLFYFLQTLFYKYYILFLYLILMVKGFYIDLRYKTPFMLTLVLFVTMSAGYFAVYVLSPHELKWLLENSLSRIILQILPIAVFLLALSLKICREDKAN